MPQKRKYFGTDGIRGHVNQHPMTTQVAHALGMAVVAWANTQSNHEDIRLLIGRDTRRSAEMLEFALAAGASAMGADILRAGVLPTPAVAFLCQTHQCTLGLMISASHNPFHDNGIKLFDAQGFKLSDDDELSIEGFLEEALAGSLALPDAAQIGTIQSLPEAPQAYIQHLRALWQEPQDLSQLCVVLDCAHGAAVTVGAPLLQSLNAKLVTIADTPDGQNINLQCGALHTEGLREAVLAHKADIGLALDGDADRLMVVDETGQTLDGDALMAIFAPYMLAHQQLPHATVVATVMSNLGLEQALNAQGIQLLRTQVGDRYVLSQMQESGAALGGEQSGHLIFLAHSPTGDGLLAALQVLQIMVSQQQTLSSLAAGMERFPQVLQNVKIREKKPWREIPAILQEVQDAEATLGNDGRVLVRYSGTENKARVMVEGKDADLIQEVATRIAARFQEALGV